MGFKLLIAMIKPGVTDECLAAAKNAGAKGATIIPGRGTGVHEAKTFFGLTLEEQTDVVLFLLDDDHVEPVMAAISKVGEFHKPGTGIAFSLPVEEVSGFAGKVPGTSGTAGGDGRQGA